MTTTIPVSAATHTYDVVIGDQVIDQVGHALIERNLSTTSRVFVVSDENVERLGYASRVAESLKSVGFEVSVHVVPPGDGTKTLDTALTLYNSMLDAGIRRNGIVVAVGGGMVGDLAGFAAATYQRGVKFVQVPTTLLAHDSSIGGKVGVNLPRGKNLVGAFHAPVAVLYDTRVLRTLPAVEWQGGMAEVIKHGMIGNRALFDSLQAHPLEQPPAPDGMEALLVQACSVKINVVQKDEHEADIRMHLNLGHTVGHAVEHVSHYALNHGYGVAIGISVEGEMARERGMVTADELRAIRTTLSAHGLPIVPPSYNLEDILSVLGYDKKHNHHGWTFALPKGIGEVQIVRDVHPDEVRRAWQATIA